MSIPSKERLNRLLIVQAQSINDTFKLLDAPAAASMGKTDWSEVMKMANEISNQATMCALLSSGSSLEQLEDFIGSYCNLLLGLVLLCHGSTVGAGPTLRASIRDFAKPVIDHSLSLLHEALSSYGRLYGLSIVIQLRPGMTICQLDEWMKTESSSRLRMAIFWMTVKIFAIYTYELVWKMMNSSSSPALWNVHCYDDKSLLSLAWVLAKMSMANFVIVLHPLDG